MPIMISQMNKLRPREGKPLAQEDSATTWKQISSLWVQISLLSVVRTFCGHTWSFLGFHQIPNQAALAVQSLESWVPGTSGDSVNAEQDARQENYSHCCWKAQGVEGCQQEWGSVLPALRKNSTLKMNQLETVHLFFFLTYF